MSSAKMLGLQARPALHLSVLTCYARSLQEDMQYRRALVSAVLTVPSRFKQQLGTSYLDDDC